MTYENKNELTKNKSHPSGIMKKVAVLTVLGGAAFWLTNFAISRTSLAAEYRFGLSISYYPMLVEALVGGLVVGFFVSFFLIRFYGKVPSKNPFVKAVILSVVALTFATVFIEIPSHFTIPNANPMGYFLMGLLFNVLRILALGVVIGFAYSRLYKTSNAAKSEE